MSGNHLTVVMKLFSVPTLRENIRKTKNFNSSRIVIPREKCIIAVESNKNTPVSALKLIKPSFSISMSSFFFLTNL